jgi:hypothetical protein
MRMIARRRKHKVGCREGEGEDLRWLQGEDIRNGCKEREDIRMVARRPINYNEDCVYK